MVVRCHILFDDNLHGTYFAGQMVTGKVTLEADKAKKVRGVALNFNGFAHTSWTESESGSVSNADGTTSSTSNTVHYGDHEDYVSSKTYLIGSDENGSTVIEPGIHTFNFACHLPITCPSSFEGDSGHIRYTIKVVLVRPWKFDETFTTGFTVLKLMDLNYESPILRSAASTEIQNTFWCGPCRTDPLKIFVNIPQSGYVPGQNIPVGVLVTNDSNVPVEEMKVDLVLLVCYYSQPPSVHTTTQRIIVTKVKGNPVPRQCKKLFTFDLYVPPTPPSCFNLCRIIQLAYQIEVEAKIKGLHANQVVCIPVTIGSIPLMNVIQQQPTTSSRINGYQRELSFRASTKFEIKADVHAEQEENNNEIKPVVSTPPPAIIQPDPIPITPPPWAADPKIPPPTYEVAIHMKSAKINKDEAHDFGESNFSPRYAVFQIPSPTAPTSEDIENSFVNTNGNTDPDKSTWL